MSRPYRKDENHDEIKEKLISLGFEVWDTAGLGNGFPDLVVSILGVTALVEIKDPNKNWRFNKKQKNTFLKWQGLKIVAFSADDVVYGILEHIIYMRIFWSWLSEYF